MPVFSWPHFSLDHKKHAEYITCADYHLAISSGIKQQMINRGVPESTINVIFNPVEAKDTVILGLRKVKRQRSFMLGV